MRCVIISPLILIGLFCAFFLGACKKEIGPKGDDGEQGSAGQNGADGYTSLLKITPFTSNSSCLNGGLAIQSGIDKNKNNILDSAEIDQTQYVCNGANASSDKVVFLPIPASGANTSSNSIVIAGELIKFNKNNYPGVDSIIFVSDPYIESTTNTSIVELYNSTDKQIIAGSTLSSNKIYADRAYLQSGNLFNNLPNKEITLSIALHSAKNGFFAASSFYQSYLILYRH